MRAPQDVDERCTVRVPKTNVHYVTVALLVLRVGEKIACGNAPTHWRGAPSCQHAGCRPGGGGNGGYGQANVPFLLNQASTKSLPKKKSDKKKYKPEDFRAGRRWTYTHPGSDICTQFTIQNCNDVEDCKVIKISGKNGVGKSSFFKEYQKTHENVHLLNTDTLKINLDVLGDVSVRTIISESKFEIPDDITTALTKTYPSLSDGQKVWMLMAKYFYLMNKEEITSPDCLLIDEMDAALDKAGKTAFWKALNASRVEKIYAITHHSDEVHLTFSTT